jgi:hypothetical protein
MGMAYACFADGAMVREHRTGPAMTATERWDYLPPDWSASVEVAPAAGQTGAHALIQLLMADVLWRALTKPQRELLLSCAAGAPIAARADVRARLVSRGLIEDGPRLTDAGRLVVRLRPWPTKPRKEGGE